MIFSPGDKRGGGGTDHECLHSIILAKDTAAATITTTLEITTACLPLPLPLPLPATNGQRPEYRNAMMPQIPDSNE